MDTKVVERSLESGVFNIIWKYKSIFLFLAVFVSVAEGERRQSCKLCQGEAA